MAKINRDTKNYISADVRGVSEEEAYNEAMQQLSSKIANFFREERPGEPMPDAIYLSNISSIYERLTSKITDNRYRVMLYVKKADLKPMGGSGNAIVLSKNEGNGYFPISTEPQPQPAPVIKTDTIVTIVNTPMNLTLSQIANSRTRAELTQKLQTLRKSDHITGAAAFPVSNANDFYIAVVGDNEVIAVLHFIYGEYIDIVNGKPVDVNKFSTYSGYWFTLPNN